MSIMDTYLNTAIKFYNKYIVPNATRKNKTFTISIAISLCTVYYIKEHILKPPKHLRHIPYIGYLDFFKATYNRLSLSDMEYKFTLPQVNAKDGKTVFLKPGLIGWEAHINHPEDIKRVLMKQDLYPKANNQMDPEKFSDTLAFKFVGGPNIIMLVGERWKKQRMIANPAFHRSMPVQLFGQLTQDMFKEFEKLEGQTINVSDMMQRWTLDVIGFASFGFNFEAISNPQGKWLQTYNKISRAIFDPFFFMFPIFDKELLWMFPKRKIIHREMDNFLAMLDSVIETKKQKIQSGDLQNEVLAENEKDLLTLMIESGLNSKDGMSDEELKSNLCLFFFAGHDTTSSALSYAIYYLATNTDVQEKARKEAISLLGDESIELIPTIEDTKNMTYINQIIKEVLRLGSPAPQTDPRINTQDSIFDGVLVPKGICVVPNIFNLHHSNKIWEDPEKFNPDRFSSEMTNQNLTWVPFGSGSRQCIGMNFSLIEQRVMLSMLLRKYEWSLPEDSIHKDKVITTGNLITSPSNLEINFKKRY